MTEFRFPVGHPGIILEVHPAGTGLKPATTISCLMREIHRRVSVNKAPPK